MGRSKKGALVALVAVSTSCTWEYHVKSAATDDLGCPKEEITVTEVSWAGGRWDAEGCGKKAKYRCWSSVGSHCMRIDESE
jgi:hypothetical protein